MFSKNALQGFAIGMLAAIIVALAVWPVLAHDSDQLQPAGPQADGSPGTANSGGSPGAEELDRVGAAGEITGQWFGGSSPLVIPAAAFTSDGFDPDGFWFSFAGGYVDGWDTACMKAPAYLPHGATVTDVCYTVYDNNAGAFTVNLQRKDQFSAAASEEMAALTTSWDDANIHTVCDTTISNPDTSMTYAYYLTTCLLAADTRLYSVRIYYRTPVFLPIIMQNYQ